MKNMLIILRAAVLGLCIPILQTSCQSSAPVTLEPGGTYSDSILATTDQSILDAQKLVDDFGAWYVANSSYLSQWPEVGSLAANVAAHNNEWFRNAYAARDAYASVSADYKNGKATSADLDAKHADINVALSVLNNITAQITTYKTQHPHA